MGFRFNKRVRIFKGLTLNLGKSGTSWTVGGPGASVNIRGKKLTGTVGIPGTGLSYRQDLSARSTQPGEPLQPAPRPMARRVVFWLIVAVVLGYLLIRR